MMQNSETTLISVLVGNSHQTSFILNTNLAVYMNVIDGGRGSPVDDRVAAGVGMCILQSSIERSNKTRINIRLYTGD